MNPKQKIGKVIFAGAGPGDPELLTLKAHRYLQMADVVITDRLVSEEILADYVRKDALILHAGKQRNREASTPQQMINELLVEFALQGKLVVRLKGGDVSIFSNILDELIALVQEGIEYEIIPGITAALGAAAYAGIPLTARNYASAVRFLTYFQTSLLTDPYWADLASTQDTLVFYMSGDTSETLVQKLLEHGISEEKHIAVIEQASTPYQQVHACPIHQFEKARKSDGFISPTLIIIGKVAALQQQFQWLPNNPIKKSYFNSVEKTRRAEVRA